MKYLKVNLVQTAVACGIYYSFGQVGNTRVCTNEAKFVKTKTVMVEEAEVAAEASRLACE